MRALAFCSSVVLIAACGGDETAVRSESSTTSAVVGFGAVGDCDARGLCVTLSVEPDPPEAGRDVTWLLTIENSSEQAIVLAFGSAQQAEVALVRDEQEAWRWSEGRVFAQTTSELTLTPSGVETVRLTGRLSVEPGTYEVTAELRADGAPAPLSKEVRVGEGA